MANITILGSGGFGIGLAVMLHKHGHRITVWSKFQEELDAIRVLNRRGQFYWDFVFVENSEGAHNSKLTEECLDKAEQLIDEAMALIQA